MSALHSLWERLRRPLAAAFVLAALALIVHYATTLDWRRVWASLRNIDATTLALAAACAAGSHLVYACTDLFARPIVAGRGGARRSMAIAFVCYAFNLNLGSWVGSVGFRYRLYGRHGLGAAEITRIIGLSLITNWSGYLLLAGIAFASRRARLPPSWEIGSQGLQLVGIGMLAALAAVIATAAVARGREVRVFGWQGGLPSVRTVLAQIGVSSANWLFITGLLWILLREHADFATVLTALALAAVAGAVAHIPAGLGVTEGVFLAMLADRVGREELLASLLAYRALYYLVPLAVAVGVYALIEARAPGSATPPGRPAAT